MKRKICIRCWCGSGMMQSWNLDGLSLIHSPPSSIFNYKCFILHHPTSNLFDTTIYLHLQLFFLHPHMKEWDIWLNKSWKLHDFRHNVRKRRYHHYHRYHCYQLFPGLNSQLAVPINHSCYIILCILSIIAWISCLKVPPKSLISQNSIARSEDNFLYT